ncbi:MAG: hypothetical protein A3I11_07590 [Elusimicrobia bacterium RIFCSPLOWO2_02_FULL_39_32]|nr:MAG: hypothetical protein UU09_C0003G0018 [Microgenomates group bacterium GW2011_GWA2_40_6]OGR81386.1 MAG: hypothetical protein A3B80_05035 [Elusimicrobia bacterium RIFCSPHIGHO2_02_FULL_39_36]OGR92047.1 MAG: hypothetical protein A3I11_07590 [Elusimicrobia bacterium RIFCSPLOWO2_02_FULL_39_32]
MKQIPLFISLFSLNFSLLQAGERLSSNMGELLLRHLQPGTTYNLTTLLQFPLEVMYEGSSEVVLKLDPVFPEENERKEGFENIPNLEWIHVNPNIFETKGSTVIHSNVTIAIPNETALLGKKFIVYLWSRVTKKGGGFGMGIGTKSRLLLTIAEKKNDTENFMQGSSYMGFKLDPGIATLKKAPLGKKIKALKNSKGSLKIINFGSENRDFKMEVIDGNSLGMEPPQGMEWGPKETEISIKPSKAKIKAGKSKKVKINLKLPEDEQFYGKKYQYLLRVSPNDVGEGISSGILFRINLETVSK